MYESMSPAQREEADILWNIARGIEAGSLINLPSALKKISDNQATSSLDDYREFRPNLFFASALATEFAVAIGVGAYITTPVEAKTEIVHPSSDSMQGQKKVEDAARIIGLQLR